ncbi:putative symplekin [Helianthus anomalus]
MKDIVFVCNNHAFQVDFVMEILSKLVNKQVWRMPKLWVGFLKCISQTQPHSFRVLLQVCSVPIIATVFKRAVVSQALPSPQLEGALNKYGSLRGPLAAYANQPSIKATLPRATLQALGLTSEPQMQQQNLESAKVQGTS